METPVRVRTVQVAVGRDHFRLDPEAEFHAQTLDFGRQTLEPQGQFFPVDCPIAERGMVVVPLAKPAIIQDQQLDAKRAGTLGDASDRLIVKIEISCFPVVDQDRPLEVAMRPATEAAAVEAV